MHAGHHPQKAPLPAWSQHHRSKYVLFHIPSCNLEENHHDVAAEGTTSTTITTTSPGFDRVHTRNTLLHQSILQHNSLLFSGSPQQSDQNAMCIAEENVSLRCDYEPEVLVSPSHLVVKRPADAGCCSVCPCNLAANNGKRWLLRFNAGLEEKHSISS